MLAADLLLSWLYVAKSTAASTTLSETMRARQRSMSANATWACACNAGKHASGLPGLLLEGVTRLEHSKSVWLSQARSAQMRSASAVARSLPDFMQVCQEGMVDADFASAHACQAKHGLSC